MKCFFHSSDLDGHCSGAIVKRKFPECECIPINYGYSFPWDIIKPNEIVYMVDFSLPIADMKLLNDRCRLIWIDHHKTAIDAALATGFVAYEQSAVIGKAGCELTWDHVYPDVEMPEGVRMLGRYDVWDETVPKAWTYQSGVRSFEDTQPTSTIWENILQPNSTFSYMDIMKIGELILKYQTKENKMYAESCCFEAGFHGHKTLIVNKGFTNSKIFDSMWDETKHQLMLVFVWRDGMWNFSLYTTKATGLDCGAIAKDYGGGGHVCAAGFATHTLPFTLPAREQS